MKILKKNQVVIIVIAVMLITAGYLNYNADGDQNLVATSSAADSQQIAEIGDAKLVNSNDVKEKIGEDKEIETTNVVNEEEDNVKQVEASQSKETSSRELSDTNKGNNVDSYFATSRLGRDTMYSQMIESYEKILQNQTISTEQKAIAQTEIKKINDLKNSIMITENLIKTKGFSDIIIFVNDDSINAIVKGDMLKQEDIAQIQNIITRELKADINNVHISNKI